MYVAYSNKEDIRKQVEKMVSTYHPENVGNRDEKYEKACEEWIRNAYSECVMRNKEIFVAQEFVSVEAESAVSVCLKKTL